MFGVITGHVPGPPGIASPLLWGTEKDLSDLFGAVVADARSAQRTYTWRFTSPEEFVGFFRRWYGPAQKAFEVLDEDGRAALAHDLAQLARRWDRNHGGSIAIPATYLETILGTLRRYKLHGGRSGRRARAKADPDPASL